MNRRESDANGVTDQARAPLQTKLAHQLMSVTLDGLRAQAGVLPSDAVVDNKTISEWTAEWWKWVYPQPLNQQPLLDSDGSRAANGQPGGSIFFLAGITLLVSIWS